MTATRFRLPTFAIDSIVGRCHVGDSNLTVIRFLRSKMWLPGWTKARRKRAYRHAIKRHAANRRLYHAVQSGRF